MDGGGEHDFSCLFLLKMLCHIYIYCQAEEKTEARICIADYRGEEKWKTSEYCKGVDKLGVTCREFETDRKG